MKTLDWSVETLGPDYNSTAKITIDMIDITIDMIDITVDMIDITIDMVFSKKIEKEHLHDKRQYTVR
jgi:hypothetical protein